MYEGHSRELNTVLQYAFYMYYTTARCRSGGSYVVGLQLSAKKKAITFTVLVTDELYMVYVS